ncbi:hypothetical protein ABD68_12655 [Bacillus endophyticus]|uniref:hypothetical protein n=1 Tax=Priestia endophytica TaxID=135735 RepID=UPI0018CFD950|nr:hypothetical protein [Priestia endophytica]MBG9812414.1 hypothetical protein [Priestia endophytica]
MKKFILSLLYITALTTAIFTYFTAQGYSGEYVKLIGNNNSIYPEYLKLLEDNNIPYKVKNENCIFLKMPLAKLSTVVHNP